MELLWHLPYALYTGFMIKFENQIGILENNNMNV